MNLKQIETFFWVAKLGSFKAAASYLRATQSTVSTRIQELEDYFSTPLFDRTRRVARLTPKGNDLFRYAERFVELAEEMQTCISETDAIRGAVRVGVSEVISATWLPQLVRALTVRYPKLALHYDVDLVADHLDRLKRGDLDLLLHPRRPGHFGVEIQSLGRVCFKWLASRHYPLPAQEPITPSQFADIPVIALSRNSNHWQTIDAWLSENGAYCKRLVECNSMDVVGALTIAGQGLGLFPDVDSQSARFAAELHMIDTRPSPPLVNFYAITQNDHPRMAVRVVADLASEISTFAR